MSRTPAVTPTLPSDSAYEPPAAVLSGTLVSLAAGTYSEGEQDDGDYYTTKWKPETKPKKRGRRSLRWHAYMLAQAFDAPLLVYSPQLLEYSTAGRQS